MVPLILGNPHVGLYLTQGVEVPNPKGHIEIMEKKMETAGIIGVI